MKRTLNTLCSSRFASHRFVPAELLYGGGNTGKFQFNNVLNLSSKTADGVVRETA